MPNARLAISSDLPLILDLFKQADVSAHVTPFERAQEIWAETIARKGVFIFVSDVDSLIVATSMLITVPNLLREGRKHGFIEVVVTHPNFQRQGHGKAVIEAALDMAWNEDCFHVMLQSGRKDPGVHQFYERCGFESGLRVAYVARRSA